MDMGSLKISLKSKTSLIVVGALAVGAVGSKMLWSDSVPAFKPQAAAASSSTPAVKKDGPQRAVGAVAATANKQNIKSQNAAKAQANAAAAQDGGNEKSAAQLVAEERAQAHQQQQQQLAAEVAVTEETEAPIAARPAPAPTRVASAGSRRNQPAEVDASSDTDGLFSFSALKQTAGSDIAAAAVNESKQTPVASSSNAGMNASISEAANNALGERVIQTANTPQAAPGSVTDGLGPVFVDDTNGYYMRFPAAWSIRKFDGQPWVVECGDGKSALISLGFSAFPAEYTADDINLDWVGKRIKKRSDTQLNAQGYATIMNRKAVWSKSTGPMQIGASQAKVVRTTYILPLGDGRVAEIRIAASPEQYEKLAGVMKNAVSTFRTVPKRGPETTVAKTE